MHKINNTDKRRRTLMLFAGYGIISLVLVTTTWLLVQVAAGYDIDRRTGQVIKNGVLLLETFPEDANVYLNDALEQDLSPSRLALPEGTYGLRLEREGYRPWLSNIEIVGSQVNWVYYPQLIPEQIETSEISVLPDVRFVEQNDEADELVIGLVNTPDVLRLYDLGSTELNQNEIRIPRQLFAPASGKIQGNVRMLEWSSNGGFMLLEYEATPNTTEIIVVDVRNPSRSKSINKSIGLKVDLAVFGPKSDDIFIVAGGILRQFDSNRASVSDSIAENVVALGVEDKAVWAMIQPEGSDQSEIVRLNGAETQLLLTYNDTSKSRLLVSNYESKSNVALIRSGSVRLYADAVSSALQPIPDKILKIADPDTRVEFSPHGRFLAIYQSNKALIYDLETKREYRFSVPVAEISGWFDANRLYYDDKGQLHLIDFTGENDTQIASFEVKWSAFIDKKREHIVTLGRQVSSGKTVLNRSAMVVD